MSGQTQRSVLGPYWIEECFRCASLYSLPDKALPTPGNRNHKILTDEGWVYIEGIGWRCPDCVRGAKPEVSNGKQTTSP